MAEREQWSGTLEELKEYMTEQHAKLDRENTPADKIAEIVSDYTTGIQKVQDAIDGV